MYTLEQQKANRKLWVEALRSGKYEQGRGRLRRLDNYCCLGVLADVAGCAWSKATDGRWKSERHTFDAPALARDFVGLSQGEGSFGDTCLTGINDSGKSFSEIADIIESEPPGLFRESA